MLRTHNRGRTACNTWCWDNQLPTGRRRRLDHSTHKTQSAWVKRLKRTTRHHRTCRRKQAEKPLPTGLGNDILAVAPKAMATEAKMVKGGSHQTESLLLSKGSHQPSGNGSCRERRNLQTAYLIKGDCPGSSGTCNSMPNPTTQFKMSQGTACAFLQRAQTPGLQVYEKQSQTTME